jgi:hypothetical protein
MTFTDRLHRRAALHAAGLPAGEALAWIAGHGLLALADHPATPEALRAPLRRARRDNAAANLHRVDRFRRLVDALGDVPVCPLKGIHLLATLYAGDPGSRVMADLDLLVPEGEVERAIDRLARGLGLVEAPASRAAAPFSPERLLRWGELEIEIHGRLGAKHGPASTWTAVAPRPARLHDRDVWALDRETTLLHLIVHFVKHGPFVALRWVEDVLRAADAGVDPARLVARARALGAFRSLAAGVGELRRLAGDDLLAGVPGRTSALDRALVAVTRRLAWRDGGGGGRDGAAADPVAAAGPRRRTAAGGNLAALLLADRPGDALHYARAKAGELWLRRRRTTGRAARTPGARSAETH